MGLSRRKFTKELKEEAVRRLELGASLAEVARACEVNPNVLHRWKRELRDYGAKAFSGNGQRRAEDQEVADLEGKVGRQSLEIDFLRRSLEHVEEQRKLQAARLPVPRKRNEPGHTHSSGTAVRARARQPGWILPLAECCASGGRRPGSTGRDSADCIGVPQLRLAAHRRRTETARVGSQPQAGVSNHARGQSALPASAEVRGDHRLQSQPAGVPEPGTRDGVDRTRSAPGGRHHLHPAGNGVRLSGGGPGRFLAAGDRLGLGPHPGG